MQGVLESADRAGALSKLQRRGCTRCRSSRQGQGRKSKQEKSARAPKGYRVKPIKEGGSGRFRFRRKGRKPKLQDSATWMLQLANFYVPGCPVGGAQQHGSISGKGISEEVAIELKQNVTEGKTLSEAMARHPVISTRCR
ncbi:MAG: hypothetical protein CM1200mP29_04210 [Verrucomicrobiota bacterium]|nr:MAG: hypothetical protein CM1200mP29_04210 [Verrucomicrobiota bacterium]